MSGALCFVLMLMSTGHLVFSVSGLRVPDPEGGQQGTNTHPSRTSMKYSTLKFNSEEPSQFVDHGSKLDETKNLETNEGQAVMTHSNSLKYSDLENQVFDKHYLDNNDDNRDSFDNPQQDDSVSDTVLSNPTYSTTDVDLNDNDENPQLLQDIDDILDSSTENDNTILHSLEKTESYFKSHGDAFLCPPCSCSHTANRFIIANCTDKKLYVFPKNLPKNTIVLNLSFNIFRNFNMTSFLTYPSLVNVSMESNRRLRNIYRGYDTNKTSAVKYLTFFDCSITNIENASFSVMPHLTNLTLRKNELKELTASIFVGVEKLESLDISVNRITKIEMGTFDNFPKLKILDLDKNENVGYSNKTLPPRLFKNLKHLRKLSLHEISQGQDKSYPNQALAQLVNLQELGIDGLDNPGEFGPEMKSLKSLTHLHLGGGWHRCKIENITETFFDNIPYLESFVLDGCPNFAYVHPDAYTKLTNLRSLKINAMKQYDIDIAFKDLAAFNNSKLTSITFNRLRRPLHQCNYLGIDHAKYVKNIDLEHMDLSRNKIALLGKDFLDNLPKTLKSLILRRNKFTTGTQSLNGLAVLKELTELDVSLQNIDDTFNSDDDSEDDLQTLECPRRSLAGSNIDYRFKKEIDDQEMIPNRCKQLDENLQWKNLSADNDIKKIQQMKRRSEINAPPFNIPPKMRILKATVYNMFGMQILTHRFIKNNSLSVVDFSKSFMSNWGSGTLPPGITHASLADNYCTKISKSFFQENNSHSHIFLSNNFLGPVFATDENGTTFEHLKNTVHLDISTNLIYKLPRRFFKGLSNLKYLKMSDNKLSYLNTSFRHMTNLQFIDLSRNSIRWINHETRNDLDTIATLSGHKLEIDLTMNSLPCTCTGLDVITWMATTKVNFRDKNLLKCESDSMVSSEVVDLENLRQTLQRLCMSKTALIIGCVAALTVVMITVVLGLMYRYRWKLRYLHNIAIAAVFGFKPDVLPKPGCTFDAYFVYTKETQDFVIKSCIKELELKRGHRLCVEDRDFLAGTYTVSNIVSAVRNSTKTVPVLTPKFYDGEYSEYSFKMAVMEELYKNRSVLHLLLYEPIPHEQMSHDELKVMKRNSYIEYPPQEEADDDIRQKFWDDLSEAIGHTENQEAQPLPDMQGRM